MAASFISRDVNKLSTTKNTRMNRLVHRVFVLDHNLVAFNEDITDLTIYGDTVL